MVSNQLNLKLVEMQSKIDFILTTMTSIKENTIDKVYDTKELCSHLKVGKSVIESLKRSGDLTYSKIGKKVVFKQSDVDELLKKTSINYVA